MKNYLKLFINRLNAEEEIINLKKEIAYKDIVIEKLAKELSEQKVCKCQKSPTILKYEVGK
jgi:uncharacterized coiled-coil protein SlyX